MIFSKWGNFALKSSQNQQNIRPNRWFNHEKINIFNANNPEISENLSLIEPNNIATFINILKDQNSHHELKQLLNAQTLNIDNIKELILCIYIFNKKKTLIDELAQLYPSETIINSFAAIFHDTKNNNKTSMLMSNLEEKFDEVRTIKVRKNIEEKKNNLGLYQLPTDQELINVLKKKERKDLLKIGITFLILIITVTIIQKSRENEKNFRNKTFEKTSIKHII